MPIIRNSSQRSKTLIEFYTDLKDEGNEYYKRAGALMLQWIDKINQELLDTDVWGLTSHDHLILQNKDDYSSTAWVVLCATIDEYHIEYLLPKDDQPWENAYVKGATKSLNEAVEMVKIAIRSSEGWKEPKE
ncbi:hypothetical protein [Pontibacter virosus]|nr:hypothetical protein [Pontibacter virosus]